MPSRYSPPFFLPLALSFHYLLARHFHDTNAGYATIAQIPGPSQSWAVSPGVHGVLHAVSPSDMERISGFETGYGKRTVRVHECMMHECYGRGAPFFLTMRVLLWGAFWYTSLGPRTSAKKGKLQPRGTIPLCI